MFVSSKERGIALKPWYPGERNHCVLLSALGFITGCICCPWFQSGIWILALLLMGLALGFLLHCLGKKPELALLLVFFALGLGRSFPVYQQPLPQEGTYTVMGYVYGGETTGENSKKSFVLTDISINGEKIGCKAYCTLNERYLDSKSPKLFDGAQVCFEGKLYHPQGKSGYPHFDFRKWMYESGTPVGISSYETLEVTNTRDTAPVKDWSFRLREGIEAALEPLLGEECSVAMALLFGDRSNINKENYAAFQKLGIAHLMSVSGLHVGIIAGLVMGLLKAFHVRKKLRLPLITLFLLFYVGLCGCTPASLRAAVMFTVAYAGSLYFRAIDRLTLLAFSALVVLIINPLDASSAGFVLSYSAMLGIYALAPLVQQGAEKLWPDGSRGDSKGLRGRLRHMGRKAYQGLAASLSLSLGAQLGVLLPTICYFHQLPTYGLLINTLLVPFAGAVVVPLLFFTLLLSWLPGVNVLLGSAAGGGCGLLLSGIQGLAKLPGASLRIAVPSGFIIAGVAVALVLLSRMVPGHFPKKAAWAAGVLAVCCALAWVTRPGDLRYIQLSVGQADSAILLAKDQTLVIDTGEDGEELLDYLLYEGRNIDKLLITHPHSDHMGGVDELLDNGIRIGCVYLPWGYSQTDAQTGAAALTKRLAEEGIPVKELSAGDRLSCEGCEIRLLWPDQGKVRQGTEANEASMVLYIRLGEYSLLNMGDLGENYEQYAALPANVLKVSHHGSAYASQDAFLETVSPDYAIISASSSSRSLPSPKTLNRLSEQGIPWLRTDAAGDITIVPTQDGLLIQPYRGEASK